MYYNDYYANSVNLNWYKEYTPGSGGYTLQVALPDFLRHRVMYQRIVTMGMAIPPMTPIGTPVYVGNEMNATVYLFDSNKQMIGSAHVDLSSPMKFGYSPINMIM